MSLTDAQINNVLTRLVENEASALCFCAPTGSGKSTKLPIAAAKLDPNSVIFCVQPTVAAVMNLYTWVKKNNKNIRVGFAAELNINYVSLDQAKKRGVKPTQVVFCTAGHCRRVILGNNKSDMDFCHILMVDEVHNPARDIDIVINVWYEHSQREESLKRPFLLMASATPTLATVPFDPEFIVIKGKKHDVSLQYHNKDYAPGNKKLWEDMATLINTRTQSKSKYKWLVFCPGVSEMSHIARHLRKEIPIYTLHGNSAPGELDTIMTASKGIIFTTNVAETSVTIPNVDGVIDSVLEKIIVSRDGKTNLVTSHISKASGDQRKGRTGRTNKGFCYRMCTEEKYDSFPENKIPELERLHIDDAYLSLTAGGLDITKVYGERLGVIKLEKSERELTRKGLLKDNAVTEKGKFVNELPLSIDPGIFLWEWRHLDYPVYPGAVAASLLEVNVPLIFYPKEGNNIDTFELVDLPNGKERKTVDSVYELYLWEYEAVARGIQSVKVGPHNRNVLKKIARERGLNNQECKRILTNVRSILDKFPPTPLAKIEPMDVLKRMEKVLNKCFFEQLDEDYRDGNGKQIRVSKDRHYHPEDLSDLDDGIYVLSTFGNTVSYFFPKGIYSKK